MPAMSAQTAILDYPETEYILPGTRTLRRMRGYDRVQVYSQSPRAENHHICSGMLRYDFAWYLPEDPDFGNTVNTTFASAASTASGLVAGLKATGREDWKVIAMAGDGGTFDMGIQSLSGAAERGTDFIYVCYDNEAYMNTGVQRSSATPAGAMTTTTPVIPKEQPKKDFMQIMEAHSMPYLASVSCFVSRGRV